MAKTKSSQNLMQKKITEIFFAKKLVYKDCPVNSIFDL